MDEEAQTSLVARQTPWPAGLCSIEEQKKKEEEEREQETWWQLQEHDRQQEPRELEEQEQRGRTSEEPLEPPPHSPPQPVLPAPQEPENQEEGLLVFGPPTPAWLCPGPPAAIPAESGWADGVVALACMMRTPVDPESEIRRTIYGMDGITPGFLRECRSWEDRILAEEDEAGTSGDVGGSKTGTWKTVDDDGRFPSLVDLLLRHGGSLETVEELIRGVKARADQEMENWCPDQIRIRASTDPSEPNIFLDDRKEAEKWEHVEELRLWMKHTVGLLSDVVNNGLGPAYFVSIVQSFNLCGTCWFCILTARSPARRT